MPRGREAGIGAFAYATRDRRVVFGAGTAERIGAELERLDRTRALLVTTRGRLDATPGIQASIGGALAGVFDEAREHVPADILQAAIEAAGRASADVCVALGGGSAVGVAKGVALETGLPIVAVPTTYAGSEMTAVWGISEGGRKRTGRDGRAAPRTILYDPLLTLDLPPRTTAASGMNAIAHAVEALYAPDENPVATLLAESAILRLADALPRLTEAGSIVVDRAAALLGAHFAGSALDLTSMGLHHKLCHVVGGGFGLPHSLVHAVILPHATAYNAEAAPDAMRRIRLALGERGGGPGSISAARRLFDLNHRLAIGDTLRDLGLARADLDRAADEATLRPYSNPAPVRRPGVRALLEAAWDGRPPP